MKWRCFFYLSCVGLLCFVESAFAVYYQGPNPSVGDVAHNILDPLTGVISIVRAICIISGIGFILSSFVKFGDHRRNRVEVTLPLVITIFVTGCCLVGLGFIPFKGM